MDVYRLPKDLSIPLEGVGGEDPRVHASRELGERVAHVIAEEMAEVGRRLLEGKVPGPGELGSPHEWIVRY